MQNFSCELSRLAWLCYKENPRENFGLLCLHLELEYNPEITKPLEIEEDREL